MGISTWIRQGCTHVPHPEPPSKLPSHSIPLGHPSAPAPSILYPAQNQLSFPSHFLSFPIQGSRVIVISHWYYHIVLNLMKVAQYCLTFCDPHGLWNFLGQNTGVGSLSLLQGIFLTQESNWGLLIAHGFFTNCAIREAPIKFNVLCIPFLLRTICVP